MIAASAVRGIDLVTILQELGKQEEAFEPNQQAVSMYERKYGAFLELHDAVGTLGAREFNR